VRSELGSVQSRAADPQRRAVVQRTAGATVRGGGHRRNEPRLHRRLGNPGQRLGARTLESLRDPIRQVLGGGLERLADAIGE